MNFRDSFSGEEIKKQILWLNSNICIDGKPLLYYWCLRAGIKLFDDLLNLQGNKLTYVQLIGKYGNCINWLQYSQLCVAIPKDWWYMAKNGIVSQELELISVIDKNAHPSQAIYNKLIERKSNEHVYSKFIKYNKVVSEVSLEDYMFNFVNLYKIARDTKSRDFQYRQLIFIVFTNSTLYKWKVVHTVECEFCHNNNQTVKHLFWECSYVKPLYEFLTTLCQDKLDVSFENIFRCCIITPITHIMNYVVLRLKMYIYRCKCTKETPRVTTFVKELQNIKKLKDIMQS